MPQSLSANLTFKENANVAYDNSFVQISNNIRPLYAQATYLANASDISINAGNINLDLTTLENIGNITNTLLRSVTASNVNIPGFSIPPHDEVSLAYVGSTNNLQTVTYKKSSNTILTLSFTYTPNPPTENDALLANVKII